MTRKFDVWAQRLAERDAVLAASKVSQARIAELEGMILAAPHAHHCESLRSAICSQPDCGEIHEHPCTCWKSICQEPAIDWKARAEQAERDGEQLRRLLWLGHAPGHILYGDDGEMRCNTCLIDFKRCSADEITAHMIDRNIRELKRARDGNV